MHFFVENYPNLSWFFVYDPRCLVNTIKNYNVYHLGRNNLSIGPLKFGLQAGFITILLLGLS